MVLLNRQRKQLQELRKLARGTNVKITLINNIGAIKISGGRRGSKSVVTMLGNNIGISPVSIVKARVSLFKKRR